MKILLLFVLIATAVEAVAEDFTLAVNSDELLYGVVRRENPGRNPNAVGDKRMRHKAYGLLQIRAPYLKDVNKIAGAEVIKRTWGKTQLTMADMKDQEKAEWAFHVYLSHYGKIYTRRTGKIPTAQVYARIHNGGPNGWRDKDTVTYGKAVVKFIAEYRKLFDAEMAEFS